MVTHMNSPKMKFLMSCGMMVKGIQRTARSRSLTLRFSRNTLVTVRILWFWTRVKITNPLPTTLSIKMIEYRVIRMYPSWSNSGCLLIVLLYRGNTLSLSTFSSVVKDIFSDAMVLEAKPNEILEAKQMNQG